MRPLERGAPRRLLLALSAAVVVALFSVHLHAQSPPPPDALPEVRSLSLEAAIAEARARQPLLLSAQARVAALTAEARVPGASWLPSVGAFAELVGATANNSTATVINSGMVDLPRVGATPVRGSPELLPHATTLAAIGVRQQLIDFGRTAAQTAAAEAQVDAERAREASARLDVEQQVTQAFHAVLAARALASAADQALARARGRRALVQATTEGGMRAPIDRTRVEADVARFEVATLRARGLVRVARTQLALAIGAAEPEVDAAGEPGEGPAAPPESAVAVQVDAHDSALLEARARLVAQEAQTRAIGALGRPLLLLTAQLSARAGGAPPSSGPTPPGDGLLPVVPNYGAGLVLTVPLFDPTLSARVDASRAREEALRLDVSLARARAVAQATAAYRSVEIADAATPALSRALAAAKANQEQAEARFRAGLGTATEVADAEALRTDAEIQISVGRFEQQRARAALRRALSEGSSRP